MSTIPSSIAPAAGSVRPAEPTTSIGLLHDHLRVSINAAVEPKPKGSPFKSSNTHRMPLPPEPTASLDCLLGRLHRIHAILVRRGFSDAVASRAVEEVLEVGRQAINSGKAASMTPEQRAGWLWTLAKRTAVRAARQEMAIASLTFDPEDRRHPGVGRHCHDATAIQEAIERLPIQQRTVVTLCIMQNLSRAEAARAMGIKVSTVCRRLQAALIRLRKELAALAPDLIPGENTAGR